MVNPEPNQPLLIWTLGRVSVHFQPFLRFFGQSHELRVNLREGVLKGDEDLARLADAFRPVHEKMYGYTPDSPVQSVTFRVSNVTRFQKAALGVSKDSASVSSAKPFLSGSKCVFFLEASGFADTPAYKRVDLPPGSLIDGLSIVEQMDTTTITSPGQMATGDECGNLVLRFEEGPGNTSMG